MIQDFKVAIRTLRNRAQSSLMVVGMLALGIAANSVVFSLLEAFLLRPLDFHEPDRLVRIYGTQEIQGGDRLRLTEGTFVDLRERVQSLESLVGARNFGLSITDSEQPLNPLMRRVTRGYFEILGAETHLGRRFVDEEFTTGKSVILDFGFWQSYYAGDPDVVGKTLELAGEPYEIVGVMPARYENPAFPSQPVLWMPLVEAAEPDRRTGNLIVLGRLASGASLADAAAELETATAEVGRLHPTTDAGRGARALLLRDSLVENIRPALWALMGAVGFVLLMACGNVANLLLARAVDRRREIGVRLALGASRRHLIRQLLSESLVLGVLAAGLGLLLAFWSIEPVVNLAPSNTNVPLLDEVRLDGRVAGFTVILALCTSVLFGLLPMAQALRTAGGAVAAGSRAGKEPGGRRMRSSLVVAEVAISLVLLIGAGLMVRTLLELKGLGLGFDPDELLVLRSGARGPIYGDPDRYVEFHETVSDRLREIPGVDDVGICEILPMFASFRPSAPVVASERREASDGERPRAISLRAGPGFFKAFGLPILQGRGFTDDDRMNRPGVAVVSRTLARRVWGRENVIGQELELGEQGENRVRVVGVAGDLRGLAQAPEPPPILYVSLAQNPTANVSYFVRTGAEPTAFFKEVERAVWSVSRDVPVYASTTLDQIVRDIEWQPRFVMQILTAFALFALVLAAAGIFAVLSYEVVERTREIGVRVAIGAARSDIVRMVLRNAVRLTAFGLGIGLAIAFVLSRFLESELYGVGATDPLTYGAVAAALALAALLSSYLPALKATRVDPVVALRSE